MNRNNSANLLYHPFRVVLTRGVELCHQAGIPIYLFEGYRSPIRQAQLYAQGRTAPGRIVTRARPFQSWHQYGLAGDLVVYQDSKWTWKPIELYKRAGSILCELGLEWLGNSKTFPEMPHYQFKTEIPLAELREVHREHGVLGVWAYLDVQGESK